MVISVDNNAIQLSTVIQIYIHKTANQFLKVFHKLAHLYFYNLMLKRDILDGNF